MKISLNWLNDHIDLEDFKRKPQELAQLLTAAGLEVESIEDQARGFASVVVGCILKKEKHPNADRLTVCQVSIGDGVVQQIVCGAKNHAEGDRVVVALPGAVLPGDFHISRSKIRDIDSSGMLCSEKELGLKSESDGILVLPADATVGKPFADYVGLNDILFELKVTPNRADCLSHFGLARELGAILNRELQLPIETLTEEAGSTRAQVTAEVVAAEMCPRFTGRGVSAIKMAPSPLWLRQRLESVGINSINNVVDITNFVMLELGQPLHAYDVRQISGRKIIVDRAAPGESFTTLDGTELKLDGTELVIRDAERPIGLAGIVGGQNSGIKEDTTEVFIEAAYFTPAAIRRTARKFGIETDASYRFARGTNPEAVPLALNRAVQLMQSIASGKAMGSPYDIYPNPIRRDAIEISQDIVSQRLGFVVDANEFIDWMKRLGCDVSPLNKDARPSWRILPPLFRWDLSVDVDLVEEFARLHGYQHIPETLPPLAVAPAAHDPQFAIETKLRKILQGEGALQAINYAFLADRFQEKIIGDRSRLTAAGLRTANTPVRLINPLTEELNVLRVSLIPGLLKNVVHNLRHGNSFGRLFEIGFSHSSAMIDKRICYQQEPRLSLAYWGGVSSLWRKPQGAEPVFSLKGALENLLRQMAIVDYDWQVFSTSEAVPSFLHPGQALALQIGGKPVGFIGTLHPALAEEFKIREKTAIAEFAYDEIFQGSIRTPKYQPVSKMPAVERDIALQISKSQPVQDIAKLIRFVGGEYLKDVVVFDLFEGGNLETGQRSTAFRLVFQSQESTLEDVAVNAIRDRIVAAVETEFQARLRG